MIKGSEVTRKELIVRGRKQEIKYNHVPYFIVHNIISMTFFFLTAYGIGLFDKQSETISDLFTNYYLPYFSTVFFLLLCYGVLSRFITYFLIFVPWYKYVYKDRVRPLGFWELNVGINKLSLGFVIASLISAFFFTVGSLYIIQKSFFKSHSFYALVGAYLIMKIITFGIMKAGRYVLLHAFTGMKL